MGDLLYLLGTVGFFALMAGYVKACERLGRGADSGTDGAGRDH
ncbi:MAG: hypothetical protein AB7L66_08600 [Gemmatimonadales bacterium]